MEPLGLFRPRVVVVGSAFWASLRISAKSLPSSDLGFKARA